MITRKRDRPDKGHGSGGDKSGQPEKRSGQSSGGGDKITRMQIQHVQKLSDLMHDGYTTEQQDSVDATLGKHGLDVKGPVSFLK